MQAIQTKAFGPTNTRGSRIRATCDARTIFVSRDYGLNDEQNHRRAAMTLAAMLDWPGEWVGGSTCGRAESAMAWVLVSGSPRFRSDATFTTANGHVVAVKVTAR